MKKIITYLFILFVLSLTTFIGILWQQLSFPPRIPLHDFHHDWGDQYTLPIQDVAFVTKDNITISGWFISRDSNTVVIVTEGWGQNRNKALKYSKLFYDLGYSVLTFDYRGQGASSNGRCTLGGNEVQDMAAAVHFIHRQNPTAHIVLFGVSMGGVTSLRYAAQDKTISGVIVDSAYCGVTPLVHDWLAYHRYGWLKYAAPLVGALFAEATIPDQQITQPTLILHSADNLEIPATHAACLAKKIPQATIVLFDHAPHGECYRTQPEQYQDTIKKFMRRKIN
jgi:pimeloyl-ACP methyl ester carboxylesterase